MNKLFRSFLEWLYLFDFIEGDLARAMFYYLYPDSFMKSIRDEVRYDLNFPDGAKCPKCGRELICNGGQCDYTTKEQA